MHSAQTHKIERSRTPPQQGFSLQKFRSMATNSSMPGPQQDQTNLYSGIKDSQHHKDVMHLEKLAPYIPSCWSISTCT